MRLASVAAESAESASMKSSKLVAIAGNTKRCATNCFWSSPYLGPPAILTPTQSWHRRPLESRKVSEGLKPFFSHHAGMSHS